MTNGKDGLLGDIPNDFGFKRERRYFETIAAKMSDNKPFDKQKDRGDEIERLSTDTEIAEYLISDFPCLQYDVKDFMDEIKKAIIGQDDVIKKLVFVAYYNQYVNYLEECLGTPYKHKSMFLIAPTGCGKTSMMMELEKVFNVPVYRANITATTSAGYIGDKVEHMLLGLIERAKGDVTLAERGILLIDEIDKKIVSNTTDKDVSGKAVQQELLKLFESSIVNVPISREKGANIVKFQTGNLTIILAGACVGLDDIREKRLGKKTIGFLDKMDAQDEKQEYTKEDLINYGFIPEFVGRIDIIQEFRKLNETDIINIMKFSSDSILKEHVQVLNTLGIKNVYIDPELLEKIASEVIESNIGMRELNNIIGRIFNPILFEAFPDTEHNTCVIDKDGNFKLLFREAKIEEGCFIPVENNNMTESDDEELAEI